MIYVFINRENFDTDTRRMPCERDIENKQPSISQETPKATRNQERGMKQILPKTIRWCMAPPTL